MTGDVTREQPVPCASPREVIARAQQAVAPEAVDTAWGLSPLFPATWPPGGETVAVLFAYVRLSLPRSIERWEARSPSLRVEIPLADPGATPRLARLDPRPLAPPEAARPERATREVMERAAAPLLDALCAGAMPAPEAAKRVREAYRELAFEHTALEAELRRHCLAFFAWLDAES